MFVTQQTKKNTSQWSVLRLIKWDAQIMATWTMGDCLGPWFDWTENNVFYGLMMIRCIYVYIMNLMKLYSYTYNVLFCIWISADDDSLWFIYVLCSFNFYIVSKHLPNIGLFHGDRHLHAGSVFFWETWIGSRKTCGLWSVPSETWKWNITLL